MAEPLKIVVSCETCSFARMYRDGDECRHPDFVDDPVEKLRLIAVADGEVMPWCPLKTRPVLVSLE